MKKRIVRQVGYLQGLYRDARSTEYKKKLATFFGRTVLFAILGSKFIRSYGMPK